ncbi:hypothetical protein FMUAM8_17330 [Nocardia cyriacigeorgica]|nr:hypothetical protein FMUAM8_17330 [Nocardia cyriacigeorgica]
MFVFAIRRVTNCDDGEAELWFSCRSSGSADPPRAPGCGGVPEGGELPVDITSAIVVLVVPSVLLIIVALTMRHFDAR